MTKEKKKTGQQELQLHEFKDFTCNDFDNFVGAIDLCYKLKEIYNKSSLKAKETLQHMWRDNLNNLIKFNDEYLVEIRQCYFELAKADIAWQSCDDHIGRYLGAGVELSKIVRKINALYNFIQNEGNRDQYVKKEEQTK